MIRKEIYIDEELDRGLKTLVARTGRAEAAQLRAALREYLREHLPAPPDQDPLLDLAGLVDESEGPDDVAEEHDHYLFGGPKRSL